MQYRWFDQPVAYIAGVGYAEAPGPVSQDRLHASL